MKNIISCDGNLEKIDPNNCSYKVFQEVLNIDEDLAYNLEIYFRYYQENRKLEDVAEITPEIINEIKKHFNVDQ